MAENFPNWAKDINQDTSVEFLKINYLTPNAILTLNAARKKRSYYMEKTIQMTVYF